MLVMAVTIDINTMSLESLEKFLDTLESHQDDMVDMTINAWQALLQELTSEGSHQQ